MDTLSTYGTDESCERHDPNIAPPLLPPDAPRTTPESVRLTCHSVRLIHQQLDTFAAGKDRVNVLHHDVLAVPESGCLFALAEYIHVSKVVMRLLQRIRRWRSGILAHKLRYQ